MTHMFKHAVPHRRTPRKSANLLLLLQLLLISCLLTPSLQAATAYTVTNTLGSGAGSFTQAVIDANANPNGIAIDTIKFAIVGAGPFTISTASTPDVTDGVFIDGYSQSGSSANSQGTGFEAVLQIVLNNSGGSALTIGDGVSFSGTDNLTVVQGLLLTLSDIGLEVFGADSVTIQGCRIHDNLVHGISAISAFRLTVGGTGPSGRCVVTLNGTSTLNDAGVYLNFSDSSLIRNCYIGTENGSTVSASTRNTNGIITLGGCRGTFIGAITTIERNVISGNTLAGIDLRSSGTGPVRVIGNHIGVDADGTSAIGNAYGLIVSRDSVTVGGTVLSDFNVISGNTLAEVSIFGRKNSLLKNRIGIDRPGTTDLAVASLWQVELVGNSNSIGMVAGGNTLSGGVYGLYVTGDSNTIEGNYIGTDLSGTDAIPNSIGVVLIGASNNSIQNNVISGNLGGGIDLFTNCIGNTITENLIGYDAAGVTILGNGQIGVDIRTGSRQNTISECRIAGHSIWGIALDPSSFAVNDPLDADTGSNDLQNFPVILAAGIGEGFVRVTGTLESKPNSEYTIELFVNGSCSPSGFGEGENLYPVLNPLVTTDSLGRADFLLLSLQSIALGSILTATATDSAGNTSPFSECFVVSSPTDILLAATDDTASMFALARADLDRDNQTDFVFTDFDTDSLYVSWGNSGGTLDDPINYFRTGEAGLVVDYITDDTLLDIVARTATTVYTIRNLGGRTFVIDSTAALVPRAAASIIPSIASGYLNNDIFTDLVVAPNTILFGDGSGAYPTSTTLGFSFEAVDVADFNNDFIEDLVVIQSGHAARTYLNNGFASFTPTVGQPFLLPTSNLKKVLTDIDLNADGAVDAIALVATTTTSADTSRIVVLLGNAVTGALTPSDTINLVGPVVDFAVSDIDRDLALDLTIAKGDLDQLLIYDGSGSGTFEPLSPVMLPAGTGRLLLIGSADLDRDGNVDFVIGGDTSAITLGVSNLPDQPVLADEMVTTGYDNLFVTVVNPNGLSITDRLRTVSGSDYRRLDYDSNGILDQRAFDYNLEEGTYSISVGRTVNMIVPVHAVGIGIDGSSEARIVNNYSGLGADDTMTLPFFIPTNVVSPEIGKATQSVQPTVSWPGFSARTSSSLTYRFQLSSYHDFRSLILGDSTLTTSSYALPVALAPDSVYYWRVAFADDPYSPPLAMYVTAGGCCAGLTGNVDGAGNVDIADLTFLVDVLFINNPVPPCPEEANVDGVGNIDIADLTYLVDVLFINNPPLPPCN